MAVAWERVGEGTTAQEREGGAREVSAGGESSLAGRAKIWAPEHHRFDQRLRRADLFWT